MARQLGPVLRHAVLLVGAAAMLAPFVIMLSLSAKPPGEIFAPVFTLLPERWHAAENYRDAFTKVPLLRFLLNGFLVTGCIFAAQALTALPMAYALAKLRWRGREAAFALVVLALLIPPQVPAIPLYIAFWQLGLLDTYGAIILPSTISVFGIFMMRQFFRTVPDDLIAAARMDGLSELAIVWRIMLPTALPALAAFGCLSFIWNWNEFFWPYIAIQSEHLAPALPAVSQELPDRPVRIIVPFPPGGGSDALARIVAEGLANHLPRGAVVENRSGANGIVGMNEVARGPADGSVVALCFMGPCALNPSLYPNQPYDMLRDFAPVILVGASQNVMTVPAAMPVRDLR